MGFNSTTYTGRTLPAWLDSRKAAAVDSASNEQGNMAEMFEAVDVSNNSIGVCRGETGDGNSLSVRCN